MRTRERKQCVQKRELSSQFHRAAMEHCELAITGCFTAQVYASLSLSTDRSRFDKFTNLMHCILAACEFDPGATTVSTSVNQVLDRRRGVCQGFARVMLACLRGHGLAAR